jgi:hypothetical protein
MAEGKMLKMVDRKPALVTLTQASESKAEKGLHA